MKQFYSRAVILSLVLFCLSLQTAFAQVTITPYIGLGLVMKNQKIKPLGYDMSAISGSNYKENYIAFMKDSSQIAVYSKMYFDESVGKTYLLLVD